MPRPCTCPIIVPHSTNGNLYSLNWNSWDWANFQSSRKVLWQSERGKNAISPRRSWYVPASILCCESLWLWKGKFKQDFTSSLYEAVQSTDPKELCERYCNQLRLPFQITKVSQEIADRMDQGGMLAGRSPLSIAAACIYTGSHLMGQPKTAKDISVVAGVSDGTIRNAYKLIYPKRELLIKPEWLLTGKGRLVGDLDNLPPA